MLLTPLWQSAQDVVDRILVLARGKQAEGGCSLTHVLTADFRQYRFLTPPGKLDRHNPVIEFLPSRHRPLSCVVVAAHGKPCSQHDVKSGVPQVVGNLNVCRNNTIEIMGETLYRPAIHAPEEPRIPLHLLLAPNGQ